MPNSLEATRRELAMLASEMMGAQSYLGQFDAVVLPRTARKRLRDLVEDTPASFMLIDPRPGLRIVDATAPYAEATLTRRHRIAGDKLFDTFPDNPDTPEANGVSNLYESIQRAAQSGRAHSMAIQRYDVRTPDGTFVERHWRPVNIPIFDDAGRLLYILHGVGEVPAEDVEIAAILAGTQRQQAA
jgi:hypothetical protein